jgi:hypothetical protein
MNDFKLDPLDKQINDVFNRFIEDYARQENWKNNEIFFKIKECLGKHPKDKQHDAELVIKRMYHLELIHEGNETIKLGRLGVNIKDDTEPYLSYLKQEYQKQITIELDRQLSRDVNYAVIKNSKTSTCLGVFTFVVILSQLIIAGLDYQSRKKEVSVNKELLKILLQQDSIKKIKHNDQHLNLLDKKHDSTFSENK